jgi:predicted GNAT family N-acyltransferase
VPRETILTVDASSPLMPAVYALRHEVFVIEQNVPPDLERDEYDHAATHLVALCGDEVIGTLRIVLSGPDAKIGRMAVRASLRKQGVGARLMQRAAETAAQMGARDIVLHAQLTARDFYRRLGYREEGTVFEEAGILHVSMRRPTVSLPPR